MARSLDISIASERTERFLGQVREVDGVLTVAVQSQGSVDPPGDVVSVVATTAAVREIIGVLRELPEEEWTATTSQAEGVVAASGGWKLEREGNEALWEEVATLLRNESNPSVNYFALMALSGCVAATGIWTDTLHLVIGAMVLAPGFQPILRIPFGMLVGPRRVGTRGLLSVVGGYAALAASAAVTALVLTALTDASTDLDRREWARYWSTLTATSPVVAVLAALAGTFTVTANRSTLSAGAMIALALVPGAALVGMGVVAGDADVALGGAARWGLDVATVAVAGGLVLAGKRAFLHRRPAIT